MGVRIYRKKPTVVEAIELTHDNLVTVIDFLHAGHVKFLIKSEGILLRTPTGDHLAQHGDYIIRGLMGEYYPCKANAFHANYEAFIGGSR